MQHASSRTRKRVGCFGATTMIHIDPAHLSLREERQARYLAAVAALRAGEEAFQRELDASAGQPFASTVNLYDLQSAVLEYDDIDARSLPLSAAAVKYGVPRPTLKKACQAGEVGAYQKPSAAGGRREWWVQDDDLLTRFLERVGKSKRGRPRKTK